MLSVLAALETELPKLLQDESQWQGLYVDYHPPVVERLWRQWGKYRVSLHRIHPCGEGEALFHPHPWPQAVRVLSGIMYEMGIGYGKGDTPPPIVSKSIVEVSLGGYIYEMTHPDGWHYVRPIGNASMSLMVSGIPWDRSSPRSEKPLRALAAAERKRIFGFFRTRYPVR